MAQTTQDCDLLLSPAGSELMLDILGASAFAGFSPSYRGSASAPLHQRWLSGGWTSHFHWGDEAYLDLFAVPPRVRGLWEVTAGDFYVCQETVALLKLTARAKDWPFATALGLKMLERGDTSGFRHIYDADLLEIAARQCN